VPPPLYSPIPRVSPTEKLNGPRTCRGGGLGFQVWVYNCWQLRRRVREQVEYMHVHVYVNIYVYIYMYIYMFIHIKQKLQDTDNHRGYFQHRGDTGRRTRSIIAGKTVKSPQTVTSKVSTGVSKNLCQTRPRTVALSKKGTAQGVGTSGQGSAARAGL